MKKALSLTILAAITCVMSVSLLTCTSYAEEQTILNGIYANNIPLGGMTAAEATEAINVCVSEMSGRNITLYTVNDEEIEVHPSDFGFKWNNPELVSEAVKIGHTGNVVERYKTKKDLEYTNKIIDIDFTVDPTLVKNILLERCATYDVQASEGLLTRENGQFVINEGITGSSLNVDSSVNSLVDFFSNVWTGENSAFQLDINNDDPSGTYEQLSLVKDVLGSFHTSFKSSSSDRCANVNNGARLINGSLIFPGEEFSFYDHIKPFTLENGYKMGTAYASGKVVDSIGGGICQVSSTLYNSVLYAELEVVSRRNHAMIVGYVDPARDATIAESSGIDFIFKNNTDAPIYIEAYTEDKQLYINLYGHETRPSDRTVEYESEILEKTVPEGTTIYSDSTLPAGSISYTGAHTGYRANLWKIVTENGNTTKEIVNTSNYNAVPRYATVGTATDNPTISSMLNDAINSGDIATVESTVATVKAMKESANMDAAALEAYQAALEAQQNAENTVEDEPQ